MSIKSIYSAINGKEARDLIRKKTNEFIDKIPLLQRGNTFHRFSVTYGFKVTAHPADVPVPEGEFEFELIPEGDFRLFETNEGRRRIAYIQYLKDKIDELQETLENYEIEFEEFQTVSAGNKPDTLRIAEGMPITVLEANGDKRNETAMMADELKIK